MSRAGFLFLIFIFAFCLSAPGQEHGGYSYVLRGEVYADLEPIYAGFVDEEYPLSASAASRRALEEAALFYSAMIYGWSFRYEIGEKARQIDEHMELVPVAEIPFGDPGLTATDTEVKEMRLRLWTDYNLSDAQQRRIQVWRSGTIRNAQGIGYAPAVFMENPGWLAPKKTALEDAARAALRSMLRGSERNRPKEAAGFISLASFPRYYIESGRWAVSARFRVQVSEIIPYAVY
ncbi:MAG: hypothetical protein LBH16_11310 [Treponema sp.]|jgi:hypothetical protein|nr:hypothetical protein [Treponema sp.]